MTKVTDSIGKKFEKDLFAFFPLLQPTSDSTFVPDFYHPNYHFWIEAKAGNVRWGPRIKDYQINAFSEINDPVIFALGYHNLDNAHKRIIQKTENGRQNYLDKNLDFIHISFVTIDIISKIWEKESRLSKKALVPYCTVKNSLLKNIFQNRKFRRYSRQYSPELFYDFSYENYLISGQNEKYSYMLNKNKDKPFLDFLQRNIIN